MRFLCMVSGGSLNAFGSLACWEVLRIAWKDALRELCSRPEDSFSIQRAKIRFDGKAAESEAIFSDQISIGSNGLTVKLLLLAKPLDSDCPEREIATVELTFVRETVPGEDWYIDAVKEVTEQTGYLVFQAERERGNQVMLFTGTLDLEFLSPPLSGQVATFRAAFEKQRKIVWSYDVRMGLEEQDFVRGRALMLAIDAKLANYRAANQLFLALKRFRFFRSPRRKSA